MNEFDLPLQSKALVIPVNRSRDWGYLCLGLGTGVILSTAYALFVYNIYFGIAWLAASALNLFAVYLIRQNH